MMLRNALAPVALVGLGLLRSFMPPPPGAFRILIFHDVPKTSETAFSDLMDRIARSDGFVTPADAASRLKGDAPISDRRVPCLISFDDGFASNRHVTEAILARHGVKALFFVCPGLIDLPPDRRPNAVAGGIFRGRVAPESRDATTPLMGWDDLRALAAAGHEIGAHSMTHRRLVGLDPVQLREEVDGSCRRLTDALGKPPDWFAWPFGDIGSVDVDALSAIAQRVPLCRSGVRGVNRPGQNRLAIFADHIDLTAPVPWQALTIAGGLDSRYRRARARLAELAAQAGP